MQDVEGTHFAFGSFQKLSFLEKVNYSGKIALEKLRNNQLGLKFRRLASIMLYGLCHRIQINY